MSWKTFFGNILLFRHFIYASDYKDANMQWAEDEKADFNVDAVRDLLVGCLNVDSVLVNIGGGAVFTYLGLVR